MAGIVSYGAYVPYLRLPLAAAGSSARRGEGAEETERGPEKAIAGWDEDALTMAVAAAVDCLAGFDRSTVDGVLFASTSYAFAEKQGAATVARALDLRRDVLTTDLGGSLRAGTGALRAGIDAIRAGSAGRVLVVIGEARLAAPRSTMDASLGDAAAAFLLGADQAIATLEGSHAVAEEILDVWRGAGEPFVHSWEERFVVDHGYRASVREAVSGLCARLGAAPADFARLALYGPDARSHAALARELGFAAANQVQGALFGAVGSCGAAFAALLLAAALAEARPGERILVASYGDGADALALRATPAIESRRDRRGVAWHLARRARLPAYDDYLRLRQMIPTEHDRRAGGGISATRHLRDRDSDVSLLGQRCRRCGQTQYPRQRVCFGCHAKDDFDRVRLSDRTGTVRSFTFDHFAGSPTPPLIATVIDLCGARLYLQMTDADPREVALDLPVELVFRKIHEAGGVPSYYWKCTPVRPGKAA